MNKEAQKLLVVVAGIGFGVLAFLAVLGFIISSRQRGHSRQRPDNGVKSPIAHLLIPGLS
jgi:hypothetical protein